MASDDTEFYGDYKFMSRDEIEQVTLTREDACQECFLVHRGECM